MESSILTAAVSFFIHIYCLTRIKIEELTTEIASVYILKEDFSVVFFILCKNFWIYCLRIGQGCTNFLII